MLHKLRAGVWSWNKTIQPALAYSVFACLSNSVYDHKGHLVEP